MPNWKKVIISGSDGSLSSLIVDNAVSASAFSGSYFGDGGALNNMGSASLARIAGSKYYSIQHLQDIFHSSGWAAGGEITSSATTIIINSGSGFIRTTSQANTTIFYFDWPANAGITIPNNSSYHVGVDYNSGNPHVTTSSTYNWDFQTNFPLGTVVNDSGILHVVNSPHAVGDHASQMIKRAFETMPFSRDNRTGGLILGETGTRNVTVTAGAIWERLERFAISAFDTSGGDTFDAYYRNGVGGWTLQQGLTQWPNTQYDNGTGTLAVLTTNTKYATLWFYMSLEGELIMVYGRQEHDTIASAEAEGAPATVPSRITLQAVLIGRILFQKNDNTATDIASVYTSTLAGSSVADHGNLAGLTDNDHPQYVLNSVTSSMSVASASYATSASYAVTSSWDNLQNIPTGLISSSLQFTNGTDPFSGSFSGSFEGDGSGLTGVTATAAPAGNDGAVQYNDNGSTGGSDNFIYNDTSNFVYATSFTGSFTGSLLGTASYAQFVDNTYFAEFTQASPATTWSFAHNLNNSHPIITIWDGNDEVVQPEKVVANGVNTTLIYFPTAQSGYASATLGSVLTSTTTVDWGNIVNVPSLVSQSAQIADDISGSFVEPSASFSTRVTDLELQSSPTSWTGSFSGSLKLTPSLPASGDFSAAEYIFGTAGGTLSVGDVCYLNGSSQFVQADSATTSSADGMLAVCMSSVTSGQQGTFVLRGFVRATGLGTFTPGDTYYLTSSAAVSNTPPSASGVAVRIVGWGYDTNTLFFSPKTGYVELV